MGQHAAKLRSLFARDGVVRIAAAHNALGAKLVERAGFDGVWSSSLEISASRAVPDADILTMSEYLAAAEFMAEVASIPVVADGDTGYGNSNNVINMVRKYELAGIAAVAIEDKQFPKVNSFIPGRQELAPVSEFVGKMMGAKAAQRDPNFMVIARCEALIAGWGLEEALRRCTTYIDAGADAILIHSKSKKPDEIFAFLERWQNRAPIVVVPTTYYDVTANEFASRGVKMIIYANHGVRSAIAAVEKTFAEILKVGSSATVEDRIAPMSHVFELQGMAQFQSDEKKFLLSERGRIRAVVPAAGDHRDEPSMREISADTPMAMLDIGGKPLLARQMEVLHQTGINDVTVVAGYRGDMIQVEGIKRVANTRWEETGNAQSFLCAPTDFDGRTLMIFSDVIFERDFIDQLLRAPGDIVLAVDSTYDWKTPRSTKEMDLVELDSPPVKGRRSLGPATAKVQRIGQSVSAKTAHGEFTGLAVFTRDGLKAFEQAFEVVRGRRGNGNASGERASVADVLAEVVAQGGAVQCHLVGSGWTEIHSLNDYKLASARFSTVRG